MSPIKGAKKITAAQNIFTGVAISRRLLSVTMATIKIISQINAAANMILSKTDETVISILLINNLPDTQS